MFCKKCGKEIPDDSIFCPECGDKCSENGNHKKVTLNINAHGILEYVIGAIKKPITTIREKGEEISSSIHIGIIAVITLLIPLIHLGVLKTFIGKIMSLYTNISQIYNSSSVNLKNRLETQKGLNEFVDTYVPFGKIYMLDILSFVIFFGLMLLLIYLVYKFVFKANVETKKFLGIISVALILRLAFTIVSTVFLLISIVPAIVVNVIGSVVILAVVILGIREVAHEEDKLIYVVAVSYGIGMIISYYFTVNYIISTIQSYFISLAPSLF